jgi:phosphoribosyl-ATP pyrophosphohydrolase
MFVYLGSGEWEHYYEGAKRVVTKNEMDDILSSFLEEEKVDLKKDDLNKKIDDWFYERGIAENGKPLGQAVKMLEEATEVFDAISTDDRVALIDAIGDVYVTLRGLALVSDLNFTHCVEHAYNEIKDRKGYLRSDGVFVKEK